MEKNGVWVRLKGLNYNMNILITGGAGFVGYNLITALKKKGHNIFTFDDYSIATNKVEGVEYQRYDVYQDYNSWKWEYEDIDIIFHMAAISRVQPSFNDPWVTTKTNIMGTQSVLEYAKQKGCKVIYPASSSKQGGELLSPYAYSKVQGENLCRLYFDHFGVESTIARFFNVYGPKQPQTGDFATVLGIWEKQYKQGKPLTIVGDGEQRRDFTHVEDIVDGLILMGELETMNCSEFELGTGKNYSINELAQFFGGPTEYIAQRKGEYPATLCKTKESQEILNWEPKWNIKTYIDNFKSDGSE